MHSDTPLSWLSSESWLSVSGCWSILLRANFLLLACLYNLIDSRQDIELRSSSLGWCAQASSTLGKMPYMTLPDIWNHLTTKAEDLGKTDCWDVDSAAGINQLIIPNIKQDKEKGSHVTQNGLRSVWVNASKCYQGQSQWESSLSDYSTCNRMRRLKTI